MVKVPELKPSLSEGVQISTEARDTAQTIIVPVATLALDKHVVGDVGNHPVS